jgi:hypothetical protein
LHVDVQQIRIGAENNIDLTESALFLLSHPAEPSVVETPARVLVFNILKKITYHLRAVKNRRKSTTKIGIEINNFYLYDLNGQ